MVSHRIIQRRRYPIKSSTITTIFAGVYTDVVTLAEELEELDATLGTQAAVRVSQLLDDDTPGYIPASAVRYTMNKTNTFVKEVK